LFNSGFAAFLAAAAYVLLQAAIKLRVFDCIAGSVMK